MVTPINASFNEDELSGLLRRAVEQAIQEEPPYAQKELTLSGIVAKLSTAKSFKIPPQRRSRLQLAVTAVAAVLMVAIILVLHDKFNQIPPSHLGGPFQFTATSPASTSQNFGTNPLNAGTSPSRHLAIASNSTVIVSAGGEDPITLGDDVASDFSKSIIHVWDWSKSKKSTPLNVSYSGSMAISPDGAKIVTADGRLIDVKTGEAAPIDNFEGRITGLRFSPDGQMLLVQVQDKDSAIARLIAFPSGKKICEIPHFWHYTFAAAFTPDSTQVALMGDDRALHRFAAATGQELAKYAPAHTNSIRDIVISDDGKQLASCASSAGEMRTWDLESGKLLHEFQVSKKPNAEKQVYALAFSHDGKLLAGGGLQNLVLWDTQTGQLLHTYPAASWGAKYIRFSSDDKSLTTVRDFSGTIRGNTELLAYPAMQQYAVESAPDPK